MEYAQRPAHDWTDVWDVDEDRDAYASTGAVDYPLNRTRVKGVGGTTLHWIGYTPRLHPKDFEMDSKYGLAADWPISYGHLQPYYAEAERKLGVSGPSESSFGPPREEPPPMNPFPAGHADSILIEAFDELDIEAERTAFAINSEAYDGRSGCQGYGTCSPVCPSGARYSADHHVRKAESEGATVIDQAPVQRLVHGPDGETVKHAVYATPDGEEHKQPAGTFVLAAGSVEIPRILLLSKSPQYPDGLANSSGLVGRYFMERPVCGIITRLDKETRQHLIGFDTSASQEFYDYDPGDSPPPGSIKLHLENHTGPTPLGTALNQRNFLYSVRDAVGNPIAPDRWKAVGRDAFAGDEWGDELLETIQNNYGTHIGVSAAVEGIAQRENRVTLDHSQTDDHGNPVPDISWTPSPFALETMDHALEIIDDILDAIGGEVGPRRRFRNLKGIGHNMGTTRMSSDADSGVVNADCRTHDLRNLYVASSSVFPHAGALQPTLTIVAMALRLADHLNEILD
jgi:choline dehydrogenase-like flavoprotein